MDYKELHEKIIVKEIQNGIFKNIGECENLKKLSEIAYIVSMLLKKDIREIKEITELVYDL